VTEPSSTRTPANKGRRLPAELLSGEEVRALLRACSARAPASIRNRALIAVLYRGGLRISEALALLPKDVDPSQGTLTVLHGKGDRRRTVGMDPAAFALLERWMDRRQALRLSGRRSVFCTLAGEPLDSSYVRRLLPRLAARAGSKSASALTAHAASSRPRECRSTSSSSSSAMGRSPRPTATCAILPRRAGGGEASAGVGGVGLAAARRGSQRQVLAAAANGRCCYVGSPSAAAIARAARAPPAPVATSVARPPRA